MHSSQTSKSDRYLCLRQLSTDGGQDIQNESLLHVPLGPGGHLVSVHLSDVWWSLTAEAHWELSGAVPEVPSMIVKVACTPYLTY